MYLTNGTCAAAGIVVILMLGTNDTLFLLHLREVHTDTKLF
jgi:hypothetical protein